jgi:hypothetical protein
MLLDDGAAFLDIFCNDVTSKRNNSSMPDDSILKYGYISSTTTDVNQSNTCFLFFFTEIQPLQMPVVP